MRTKRISLIGSVSLFALAAMAVALGSCSGSSSQPATCASTAAPATTWPTPSTGAVSLQTFTQPADPGAGGVLFSASGEVLALTGYPFPPVNDGDPAFVDGWDVHFTRLLVTVDNITLSNGPNIRPGDQSCTEPTVAKVTGPWAIDLAHSDSSYLPGKGGTGEQAVPIAALAHQNYPAGNGAAFDTSGAVPYAFGFDLIPAATGAVNVNLDSAGVTDYQDMATNGCVVLYVGTATFKGSDATCTTPGAPSSYYATEYAGWPQTGQSINFHLCYKSPTSYVNCQNPPPDNGAKPFVGEENPRGLLFKNDQSVIAQVTVHTDHPFWDSVLHDSPAHFDQYAATVAGKGQNGVFPTVTLEMTKGVPYAPAYKDTAGNSLYWRYCIAPPTDVHAQFPGPMAFDAQSVSGLIDYYDFATYDQSTQGHLNSDGLCYVDRHYPSPK
jgi:hypothetical protein